jgi:type IV secretory pathway TrbF-like protein
MGALKMFLHKKKNNSSVTLNSISKELYMRNAIPMVLGIGGLALGFFSLAYLMVIHKEPKVIPYIVTVDRQGSILASDELKATENIPETAVAAFMCDFIEKVFSICHDSDLQREYVRRGYSMVDLESQARRHLDAYYNGSELFKSGINTSQTVKIESVSRLSDNSFAVDYTLITEKFDDLSEKHYKSVLSYRIGSISFENVEQLRLNPLSLLIYEIKTSRKITKESENA